MKDIIKLLEELKGYAPKEVYIQAIDKAIKSLSVTAKQELIWNHIQSIKLERARYHDDGESPPLTCHCCGGEIWVEYAKVIVNSVVVDMRGKNNKIIDGDNNSELHICGDCIKKMAALDII